MSRKIRKTMTVHLTAEVADTDDWAAEYGFDPADVDSIQSDIGEWLHTAVTTVITELPGVANSLIVTSIEAQITGSQVVGDVARSSQTWTFLGHWEGDSLVLDHAVEGAVQDTREDDGTYPEGLFAASATAPTMDEAEEKVRAEYEHAEDDEADNGLFATDGPSGWEVRNTNDDVVAGGFPSLMAAERYVETH